MSPIGRRTLLKIAALPALNEQMRGWNLLFPTEQRTIRAQLDWLARLPSAPFDQLFEPVKQLEARMDLPAWNLSSERLSIDDTSILVRSPYYPQWRAAVEKVFEQIDAGVHEGRAQALPNRLLVCTLPAGLPLPSGPIWPGLEKQGRWIPLQAPFGTMLDSSWQPWPPASHARKQTHWSALGHSSTTPAWRRRRPRLWWRCHSTRSVPCAASFSSA